MSNKIREVTVTKLQTFLRKLERQGFYLPHVSIYEDGSGTFHHYPVDGVDAMEISPRLDFQNESDLYRILMDTDTTQFCGPLPR